MFELQIIIPLNDNDGKEFTAEHHLVFEKYAASQFGGITRYSEVDGIWIEKGRNYSDHSRLYGIAVASITEGEKIRLVVEFAKSHYRQLSIFIKYLGQVEIL